MTYSSGAAVACVAGTEPRTTLAVGATDVLTLGRSLCTFHVLVGNLWHAPEDVPGLQIGNGIAAKELGDALGAVTVGRHDGSNRTGCEQGREVHAADLMFGKG